MNTERWYRIEVLFEQALALPEAEREGFLDGVCAGDPGLRRELAGLVAGSPTWESKVRGVVIEEIRLLADDDIAARLGGRVGRFRLISWLGGGGMGDVYLAERDDAQFSQRVAIKFLPHSFGSPSAIARFRDERQILAALDHPNIVRLLDGGSTDDDLPYLVMEYIEGRTITQHADREQLSVRRRVELVRQVCAALQYAHRHLVVHRDIKPSNILVDADGAPKILDFGIAKLLAPVGGLERKARTVTGAAMFTPEYASPEQARGDAVSTASDVYSIGAVLYELMAGAPPLRPTGNALERLRVICEVDPARPSAVAPGRDRELAGDLDNIIVKALHKDPGQRYPSMEQLSDDLGRWLDGLPVRARTATLGYRAGKFVRRRKRALAVTALVIAVLVAATATSLRQASQIRSEQSTREQLQIELDEARRKYERVARDLDETRQRYELLERDVAAARETAARVEAVNRELGSTVDEAAELLERALGSNQPPPPANTR